MYDLYEGIGSYLKWAGEFKMCRSVQQAVNSGKN